MPPASADPIPEAPGQTPASDTAASPSAARRDCHPGADRQLPRLRRRAARCRRHQQRDAGLDPGSNPGSPHHPAQASLPLLRHPASGASSGAGAGRWPCHPRTDRPRAGQPLLRPPAAVSPEQDLCPARVGDQPLHPVGLDRCRLLVAGGAARAVGRARDGGRSGLRRRHPAAGARSRARPDQDRPALGLHARRPLLWEQCLARRGFPLRAGPHRCPPGRTSQDVPRHPAGGWLRRVRGAGGQGRRHPGRVLGSCPTQVLRAARGGLPVATEAVQRIGELYEIEATIRGRPPDERLRVRQQQSCPWSRFCRLGWTCSCRACRA